MNTIDTETTRTQSRVHRIQSRLTEYLSRALTSKAPNPFQRHSSRNPLFAFALDTHLRITALGGTGLEEFGLTSKDIVGRIPGELLSPDNWITARITGHLALKGLPVSFDYKLDSRWLSIEVEPIHNAAGTISGIVAVVFDLTGQPFHNDQTLEEPVTH